MEKNIGKSLSSKYAQKLLATAKELAADSLKTASNRAIQKKQQKKQVIWLKIRLHRKLQMLLKRILTKIQKN